MKKNVIRIVIITFCIVMFGILSVTVQATTGKAKANSANDLYNSIRGWIEEQCPNGANMMQVANTLAMADQNSEFIDDILGIMNENSNEYGNLYNWITQGFNGSNNVDDPASSVASWRLGRLGEAFELYYNNMGGATEGYLEEDIDACEGLDDCSGIDNLWGWLTDEQKVGKDENGNLNSAFLSLLYDGDIGEGGVDLTETDSMLEAYKNNFPEEYKAIIYQLFLDYLEKNKGLDNNIDDFVTIDKSTKFSGGCLNLPDDCVQGMGRTDSDGNELCYDNLQELENKHVEEQNEVTEVTGDTSSGDTGFQGSGNENYNRTQFEYKVEGSGGIIPEFSLDKIKDILNKAQQGTNAEIDELGTIIEELQEIIFGFARLVIFAAILLIGVRCIWSGVEGKAQFLTMLPYLLAAIAFTFAAQEIVELVIEGLKVENNDYSKYGEALFGSIVLIVRIAAFAGIIFTGVKLMFASPEAKADTKSHIIPILIGCLIVFSTTWVVSLVADNIKGTAANTSKVNYYIEENIFYNS